MARTANAYYQPLADSDFAFRGAILDGGVSSGLQGIGQNYNFAWNEYAPMGIWMQRLTRTSDDGSGYRTQLTNYPAMPPFMVRVRPSADKWYLLVYCEATCVAGGELSFATSSDIQVVAIPTGSTPSIIGVQIGLDPSLDPATQFDYLTVNIKSNSGASWAYVKSISVAYMPTSGALQAGGLGIYNGAFLPADSKQWTHADPLSVDFQRQLQAGLTDLYKRGLGHLVTFCDPINIGGRSTIDQASGISGPYLLSAADGGYNLMRRSIRQTPPNCHSIVVWLNSWYSSGGSSPALAIRTTTEPSGAKITPTQTAATWASGGWSGPLTLAVSPGKYEEIDLLGKISGTTKYVHAQSISIWYSDRIVGAGVTP